jgi:ubiquitin C-terminal hydrolase
MSVNSENDFQVSTEKNLKEGTAKTTSNNSSKKKPPVLSRAFKRYLLYSSPNTLVIHIKRFEQTGINGNHKKLNTHVLLEEFIDLDPFMAPRDLSLNKDGTCVSVEALKSCLPGSPDISSNSLKTDIAQQEHHYERNFGGRYRLYAVVVHSGTLFSGHYNAFIRIPSVWKEHENDQHSTPSVKTETKSSTFSNSSEGEWMFCSDSFVKPVSWQQVSEAQAYIVFYEKVVN